MKNTWGVVKDVAETRDVTDWVAAHRTEEETIGVTSGPRHFPFVRLDAFSSINLTAV